jgi:hypothetical protein
VSGYPNPKDIVELRSCLLALKAEDAEVAKATADELDAKKRLEGAKERVRHYLENINDLMANMDCAQPGNHGYKNRLITLLTALAER